ncbi:MAG: M20/M25/M40 family metallo-hydrolase [Corynebacterium sp.]|uniref:M20/M25/M40 family metallo-hydrolase n=1 Tax=Corynebacterium sp. TaxID=1720 RepID=UPI0026DC24C9|nr:M20/M25/M40 family metallo-hydrolase [Corynebacterium sp.]MDO4761062.1 M20/M25/M40 family metallo-hydrolase [Corynebacterium sp.]
MQDSQQLDCVSRSIENDRERIFQQLKELVGFHSVFGKPELESEMDAAAKWVEKALVEAGLEVNPIVTADGSTVVIGTRDAQPGAPTVLLYSHYDVVPVGDVQAWTSHPLDLTERNGRWYGRGTADCKGNLIMHLAALRAVAAAGGTDVGLVVVVEGSEESGGAGLSELIRKKPELFTADMILIADAGNAHVGQPSLTVSLRGNARLKVTVSTLEAPVHSGMYGGAAPDAVLALMSVLSSVQDGTGRLQVEGLSTPPWPGAPYPPEQFVTDAQLLPGAQITTDPAAIADAVWAQCSFAVTGISATPVEQAFNVINPTAKAVLDLRVPPVLDPTEVAHKVAEHIKAHTPWGARVEVEIDDINRGFDTDPSKQGMTALSECLTQAYGVPTTHIGMGATIPLCVELQDAHPQAEVAIFGIEEPLCTIHSVDESVNPKEIEKIAIAEALFLLRYHSS